MDGVHEIKILVLDNRVFVAPEIRFVCRAERPFSPFLAKKALYMLLVSDGVPNQQRTYFDSFVASHLISFVNRDLSIGESEDHNATMHKSRSWPKI